MKHHSPTRPLEAFTLLELLVSMSILTLLIVFVAQLVSSASAVTTNSRKHMDADAQARLVFDRMAVDFGRIAKTKSADAVFYKNTASGTSAINDAMFFYSEGSGYWEGTATDFTNRSSSSLIGYRINSSLQLERLGKMLSWDNSKYSPPTGGGMVTLSYKAGSAIPDPSSTILGNWTTLGTTAGASNSAFADGKDGDYHVIGDQVYRMEILFLLADGTISNKPIKNTGTTTSNLTATNPPGVTDGKGVNFRWYDTSSGIGYICTNATVTTNGGTVTSVANALWNRIGIQDVSAIIVALAILDNGSRKFVTSASQMDSALPDPTTQDLTTTPPNPPKLMAQTWEAAVNSTNFASKSGIPQAAASQVRIYQRTFYLNN
jgi:type II secretory pathway component PulJ